MKEEESAVELPPTVPEVARERFDAVLFDMDGALTTSARRLLLMARSEALDK